jgi:hypothetical protein
MWDGEIGSLWNCWDFVVECISGLDLGLCVIREGLGLGWL